MDKKEAKKMLFKTADIIEKNNLMFFLTDGVCLGAYREKNFIAWDDDIDLKMKAEDLVPNLERLVNEFADAGFRVNTDGGGLNLLNTVLLHLAPYNIKLQCTSMFLVNKKRREPGIITTTAYPAYLFENPEQIVFLGRKFYVPTPITEYFELTYGSDYMIPKKEFEGWDRPSSYLQLVSVDERAEMEALQ